MRIANANTRTRTALALLAALLVAGSACTRARPTRIVLITIDTLRYDSFAGAAGEPAMPWLRQWASRGASFERFYAAAPSTQPTHASLMTGLHPWQHGVTRNRLRLADELETIPERLRAAGYSTAAVVASFPLNHRFGFDQGFERYDDRLSRGGVGNRWRLAARRSQDEDAQAAEPSAPEAYFSLADEVLAAANGSLDAAQGDRQFFWFHLFDPHSPYGDTVDGATLKPRDIMRQIAQGLDPAPALRRARELYDADVRSLDAALAGLLERLDAERDRFETHVVLTSDHGESFGDDNSTAHGRRLTREQIQVPLILVSPRVEPGPRDEVAGSVDVAATLLALAGLDSPGGRSLLEPPRRRPSAFGMRRSFETPFEDRRVDGSVVMLQRPLFYVVDSQGTLYRGNAEGLMPPSPDAADELNDRVERDLRALFGAFEREWSGVTVDSLDDPETLKALKALGYTR